MRHAIPAVAAAVCVAGAGAATFVAVGAQPETHRPVARSQTVDVSRSALACPGVPARGGDVRRLTVMPGPPSGTAAGRARVTVVGLGDRPEARWTSDDPRRGTTLTWPGNIAGAATVATGAPAPDIGAARIDRYDTDARTGLAVAPCRAAGEDAWLTGVSTSVGTSSALVLANPGRATAVVDLRFFGPRGEVDSVGARGIAVAGGTQQVLPLPGYAPGQEYLTVHAHVTSGQLGVAAFGARSSGLVSSGAEWVPSGQPPATSRTVGPIGSHVDEQTLVIANPGDRQALVRIEAVGADGTFAPSGLTRVDVPPRSVVSRDVVEVLDGGAGAFRLTSDQPVTGAVVADAPSGGRDHTVVGSLPPLTGPASFPVGADTGIELAASSSSDDPAVVAVTARAGDGTALAQQRIDVEPATTRTWQVPDRMTRSRVSYVTVETAEGPAPRVAVSYDAPDEVASLPLVSGSGRVLRPGVLPAG